MPKTSPVNDSTNMTVDHLFRRGGGFAGWGQPDFREFCGKAITGGLCGRIPEEHSPQGFAARERLRDAAPQMLEALLAALEQTEDGLHSSPCDEPNCWVERARAALTAAAAPSEERAP